MNPTEHALKITVATGAVSTWKSDALIVGVYEGGEAQAALSLCGEELAQEVQQRLQEKWIKGGLGESILFRTPANSGLQMPRIVLLGLGKKESLTNESFRALGGHIHALCNKSNIATCHVLLSLDTYQASKKQSAKRPAKQRPIAVLESLAEGAWLSSYRFEHFKSKENKEGKEPKEPKEEHPFKQLVLGLSGEETAQEKKRLLSVEQLTRGVAFARNLGNQPPNLLNPETLAQQARQLAERLPAIKTTIYAERMLVRKGMNGILAVGGGSRTPPCLITLEYRHGGDRPLLAVVGKGITFDSGGLNIKSGEGMAEMKYDMCGAAAVFGFVQAVAEMELPINLVGVVPAAENMPSATAQRPGDIIKTAKGLFVEVLNTDAEGRLILADALHHASSFKPAAIIDLATLTGACVVALGSQASGLMGNNPPLLRQLEKAGERSGDRLWQLPMFPEYQEQIKSTVADIKNVGGKGAGTITAACFLSRFVEENQAWAHIDIAGTAYDTGSSQPHMPKGAVGVGVRLLYHFVQKNWL
ncbi:MAG: leucyl aminopeptidase [Magnetococcales bacterium]|nr:leucyl aminopeptidase [Magnetococcales bacterium]